MSAIYIEIKKKKKKARKLQKDEENCMGYTGALNIHYKGWSCSYFWKIKRYYDGLVRYRKEIKWVNHTRYRKLQTFHPLLENLVSGAMIICLGTLKML